MKGTKFQLKVWNYLKTIPKGTVKTYKEVAIATSLYVFTVPFGIVLRYFQTFN